jgi:hypothetical protein
VFGFVVPFTSSSKLCKMVAKTILLRKLCKNGGENHFAEDNVYKTIFDERK